MKKYILNFLTSFTLPTLIYFIFTISAFADTSCQPIYGGGETCIQVGQIQINKKVFDPSNQQFIDNLGINDVKFSPDQTITFQLVITNTGDVKLSKVTVKDIFPQFVGFISGPGSFDNNTKTLTFDINDLNSKESRNFKVVGKVAPANQINIDSGSICVVNQSTATSNNQTSQDNSQFCIEKKALTPTIPPTTKGGLPVLPPSKPSVTPPTGPETLPLLAMIPTALFGYYFKRISINSFNQKIKN